MRKFEVILTYKSNCLSIISSKDIIIKQQKILEDIELNDSQCFSPEDFFKCIINDYERPDVVRINIKEKSEGVDSPLKWILENMGRVYFYNGVPLLLNRN